MSDSLASLRDSELTERLYQLRGRERRLQVAMLLHVAEVDRRRLYLALGHPSLFAFLTSYLGYTDSAAFRRCTAARLLARFPVLAEHLGDGRLNLTTLCVLRDVLDEEHLEEILSRAAGRSEDEVKRLVAALRPRPPEEDSIRKRPSRPQPQPSSPESSSTAPAPPPPPTVRVEHLNASQHLLRATVGDEFLDDLKAVRAALSHKLPGAGLEALLHECMRVTLGVYEKRRRGAGRAALPDTSTSGRYLPAALRDAVWTRDQGRCTFLGSDGHRCDSTHQLQFHHIVPFARGGAATVDNMVLHCSIHNRFEAERDFGAEHVHAAITRARDERQGTLF